MIDNEDKKLTLKDLYVISIFDEYLIYSPLRKIAALVNKKAIIKLKEMFEGKTKKNINSEDLYRLFCEFKKTSPQMPSETTGKLRPNFIGLIPTRRCNLSCVYCDFGADTAPETNMDFSIAVTAVDWMAKRMQELGRKILEIHFFGGEPFVAEDVIDVAVHRARRISKQTGLTPRFEVATNGYFNEKRAFFLGDYLDTVILSFDGPKEIHDRYRPVNENQGSFEKVVRTAELLSNTPADLCFRTCVTKESVTQMQKIARWFCEGFKPTIINFEPLQATAQSEEAGLEPPDPYDFAREFLKAYKISSKYGVRQISASSITDQSRYSFCPLGTDTMIVSPDGRISGCYLPENRWKIRGLDLNMGYIKEDGSIDIDEEAVNRLRKIVRNKPLCENCFCRWTCAGGCHVNNSFPGSSYEYGDFCIQTRIITAGSLLNNLGLVNMVDSLIENDSALQEIARRPSYRLEDWEGTRVG
jgi:uncharacterized protein